MMTLISIWPPLKFLYCMKNFKYIIFFPFFQIEGEVEKDSEVRATYKDLHAKVWSLFEYGQSSSVFGIISLYLASPAQADND